MPPTVSARSRTSTDRPRRAARHAAARPAGPAPRTTRSALPAIAGTHQNAHTSSPHRLRTRGALLVFAGVDLAVGLLTLATQVFATGSFIERFGTGVAAGALPAVFIAGFAALAFSPSLAVVLMFQVAQRWLNFAIANPARQVFFTVVDREEKYKAKNLIDVVVYRGSDALSGWAFDGLQFIGFKLGALALCALPVAAAWLALSLKLGSMHEARAAQGSPEQLCGGTIAQ